MNLSFTDNERRITEMSLVLALVSNGCTFEQTKKIIECKQNSLQTLVSHYFGKSRQVHENIRKFLSDEQCLRIWLMVLNEKTELKRKYLTKLIYPSFICFFTFMSMIFFKVTLLTKIKSMFESVSNDLTFIVFDSVFYVLTVIYLLFFIVISITQIVLHNPSTRNYVYLLLYSKFKNNVLTIYCTGLFAKILLECFKSGVSTQNSLEILGKFSDFPFVTLLARNCTTKLNDGNTFSNAISSIETDSSFKIFMLLGFYSSKVTEQLSNYCTLNRILFETKLKRFITVFYTFVYIQFFISTLILYQIIQIPMAAISSHL